MGRSFIGQWISLVKHFSDLAACCAMFYGRSGGWVVVVKIDVTPPQSHELSTVSPYTTVRKFPGKTLS